jgi:hypothetical protein
MSLGTWCLARISCCMQCSIAWHGMPRFRINGCAHSSSVHAWLVMLRFESVAARVAAACCLAHGASLKSGAACNAASRLARDASLQNRWLRAWQQCRLACDASLRINGCAHGGSIAWHMVPSSIQLLHTMQHRVALDASLQNRWLRTWQQRCLARDALLPINGCTHGGNIAWYMVPSLNQLLHAMQHRLTLDASLQNQRLRTWRQHCLAHDASLRINSCAHGGSIAWHMMPRSNQLLHAMQHCAWHVMPRFESTAARVTAAPPGIWCLAQIRYCMQCSIAWHWMPRFKINGCAHGSSVEWLVMPRFESMAARLAAASLGTWCLAQISCYIQCSIAWHWMPRYRTKGCAHEQRCVTHDASPRIDGCTHGGSIAWHMVPS